MDEKRLAEIKVLAMGDETLELIAEVERLREGLKQYANKDNWSVEETDIGITYIDWMGEHRKMPWEIARRALAGE